MSDLHNLPTCSDPECDHGQTCKCDPQEYIRFLIAQNRELEASNAKFHSTLMSVKKYHEWVKKEHIWHLEANAQVGLVRLLKEIEEVLY